MKYPYYGENISDGARVASPANQAWHKQAILANTTDGID
jgi:hypothetical protein